jgi:urea transport system substrate-binding protein
MVGDYVCGHYFQCLDSSENRRFLERLGRDPKYGAIPVVSDAMVATYMGVKLWAQAVKLAGTYSNIAALRTALVSLKLPGPGGPVQLDPVVLCDAKYARVARVDKERRIVIDWSSPRPVQPVAYPTTRTPDAWDEWIGRRHVEWGGHWSNRKPVETFGSS